MRRGPITGGLLVKNDQPFYMVWEYGFRIRITPLLRLDTVTGSGHFIYTKYRGDSLPCEGALRSLYTVLATACRGPGS